MNYHRLLGTGTAVVTPQSVKKAEEKERAVVGKTINDRIKCNRHVIFFQRGPTGWLESEEFDGVRASAQAGDLVVIGLPGGAKLATTLLTAESILEETLKKGQALDLNYDLLEAIIQQALVEEAAAREAQEALPLEVTSRGRRPKRRREGRVSVLTEQYAAPPVYVRPDDFQPVRPDDQTDRTLAELIGEPTPGGHLRVAADGDDAAHRAIMADQLDPVLSMTEQDRRRRWLELDPEIRRSLRQLHVQFGHPTNTTLQRILRRQGAKPAAIRGVDYMSCDACGDTLRRKRPKPVRLPSKYEFNAHIQADVLYCKDVRGQLYSFLNVVCDATGFQVVSCMGQSQGPPATRAVLRHFLTSWSSWAGLPASLQVDRGKEFLAHFADYFKTFGVEQEAMPLEAPWKGGKVERAGGLWKEVFQKTVLEMQLSGLQDMIVAASIVTQTRNSFPRTSGFSPNQWVLGKPEIRLPGSILTKPEAERLEVLEAAEDPGSMMARNLGIREASRVAQIRLDTDGRVRSFAMPAGLPTPSLLHTEASHTPTGCAMGPVSCS